MATASDIIRRALRLIGVLDSRTALEAGDAEDALATLNAMLAEWYEAKIGLPDYRFSSLTDTLASDDADRDAIAYQLAIRVAPEYGRPLSPEFAGVAAESMNRLRLRYFQPGKQMNDLPHPVIAFNIVTGDWP